MLNWSFSFLINIIFSQSSSSLSCIEYMVIFSLSILLFYNSSILIYLVVDIKTFYTYKFTIFKCQV